jgi:hypothetical protein
MERETVEVSFRSFADATTNSAILQDEYECISYEPYNEERLQDQLTGLCRAIREERSIFWQVLMSVIVKKKVHVDTCLVSSGNRDRTV